MTNEERPLREVLLEMMAALDKPLLPTDSKPMVDIDVEWDKFDYRKYSDMQQISPEPPPQLKPNRRDRRKEQQSQKRQMKSYFNKHLKKKP